MPGKNHFQLKWCAIPDFSSWLRHGPDKYLAHCSVCAKDFRIDNAGVANVRSHAKGKGHIAAVQLQASSKQPGIQAMMCGKFTGETKSSDQAGKSSGDDRVSAAAFSSAVTSTADTSMMKKPYFLDLQLPALVREYMESHHTVDADLCTEYLVENVFAFHKKKVKAFRNSVRNAIEWNEFQMKQEKDSLATDGVKESSSGDEGIQDDSGITALEISDEVEKPSETPSKDKESALESEIESCIVKKVKKSAVKAPVFQEQEYELQELQGIAHLLRPISNIMNCVAGGASPAVSLLLQGPHGSGKTTLMRAVAKALQMRMHVIDMEGVLFTGPLSSPAKRMQEELAKAVSGRPAVVLLHQLELLYSRDGGWSSRQYEQRAVQSCIIKYITGMETYKTDRGCFLLVAETSRPEILSWELKKVFQPQLTMTPPSVQDKKMMLQMLCGSELSAETDLEAVALKASGFVAQDLTELVKNAKRLATYRTLDGNPTSFADAIQNIRAMSGTEHIVEITTADLLQSAKLVTPSLKRNGFPVIPETTWQDIGGLRDVIESLRDRILLPIKEPHRYKAFGADAHSGTLLWGPPGCGKTLLAKAVANEAGINLLTVNGPELLSMYQGESEKAVREVFARAATVAPCIIFFDEFDSLCPRRSKVSSESGSKATIVNMMLTEMDGFSGRAGIYMIAATNLPKVLDPAVLRPGRFDTKLYVGLPDVASRVAVFRARTKNGTLPCLAPDVDWQQLASREECEDFTGADCSNLVGVAIEVALKEEKSMKEQTVAQTDALCTKRARDQDECIEDGQHKKMRTEEGSAGVEEEEKSENVVGDDCSTESSKIMSRGVLYARHFEEAFKKVKPSLSEKDRKEYLQMKKEYS